VSVTEIAPRSDDFERTPPHDVAAEQCVLGGMLLSKDAISDVIEVIRPADHYRPAHQLIHDAILDLYSRGEPADAITVANELTRRGEIARVGGAPYLHTLIASVPTAANAGYYSRIVRERAILRRLVEAGTRIVQFGYAGDADADELVDRAQAEVYAVTERRTSEDYHSLSEIMPGALDEIEAIGSHGGVLTGVPTGFADLDILTNGLHPGQMVVIAARPGMGKALALDTPLPTPTGWTTMGEVQVGEYLLGADGQSTRVVAATAVLRGRPCYEMEFSGGEVIVADENHQWVTWDRMTGESANQPHNGIRQLLPPQVVTTGTIAQTLRYERALGQSNHAVAMTARTGQRGASLVGAGRTWHATGPASVYSDLGPTRWQDIVNVRPVPSRPVRCVQVDSADHLYLAGRSMIPTHNSTLALDFARAAAIRQGMTTVLFSLEMARNEITMRLLSAEARVPLQTMRTGQMNDDDWARLARRMSEVADAPLFIDDSPNMAMMEIRAKCRRLKQRHDLKFVIVDYLQLMSSPKRIENRQQEVSDLSRSLKLLAKELEVPVVALSQLNRSPEQRTDKKPMLSDLRESGCMTGDTALLRADTGVPVTFGELMRDGCEGVLLWSLDEQHRLVPAPVTKVFHSGTKEVYLLRLASGREVKASANHPFLAFSGWTRLENLRPGDRLAIARHIPEPVSAGLGWSEYRLGLLAHLIGDGCVIRSQPVHYTSNDQENLAFVEAAAAAEFGILSRRVAQKTYLPAPHHCIHGRGNPLHAWFRELGIEGLRSHEKRLPAALYSANNAEICMFLRHLWATDGCVWLGRGSSAVKACYASSSRELAYGVAHLLARLKIIAHIKQVQKVGYQPSYHVIIADSRSLRIFCERVGVHGRRGEVAKQLAVVVEERRVNTNVDTVPIGVWDIVKEERVKAGLTEHQFQAAIRIHYCGSALYKSCPSRERLMRCAEVLGSETLREIASSDLYWDRIVSIESLGPQPVYDATVKATHNFIADGLISHNSIEQDSDVVILLHREDAYEKESPRAGEADLIVAKHRNGPTATVTVAFQGHYSRFVDMAG
jgi:replicative DNA helicase